MYIEQLYTNCLSQASYYIESDGEAAIIDPLRDYALYVRKANERDAEIKLILETHFHADFVSGHLDLAKETGAQIVYGPGAETGYEKYEAKDGERLKLGKLTIEVLHTPGHTLESSCYLLFSEEGKPHALFSGDTLFVGDVGRPDLLDGVMNSHDLAGMMYDSLMNKIMPLADDILLYPAHGPGSACGKNLGPETFSTIGAQKRSNYALQPMSKEAFIKELTEGIAPAPAYFYEDARLNRQGYAGQDEIMKNALKGLDLERFKKRMAEGAWIVDTRIADDFEKAFIPGSINIGLNGQFAIWAASIIPLHERIVLVCDEGRETESINRLTRVGFDTIVGYLKGGFSVWQQAGEAIDMVISIEPDEFAMDYRQENLSVLDVRKQNEWNQGHVKGARLLPLANLPAEVENLEKNKDWYVHCAGGYRSMIAASLMKKHGIKSVRNVYGGWNKIKEHELTPYAQNKQA